MYCRRQLIASTYLQLRYVCSSSSTCEICLWRRHAFQRENNKFVLPKRALLCSIYFVNEQFSKTKFSHLYSCCRVVAERHRLQMLSVPLDHGKHLDDIGRREMTHHTIAPSSYLRQRIQCFIISVIEAKAPQPSSK